MDRYTPSEHGRAARLLADEVGDLGNHILADALAQDALRAAMEKPKPDSCWRCGMLETEVDLDGNRLCHGCAREMNDEDREDDQDPFFDDYQGVRRAY